MRWHQHLYYQGRHHLFKGSAFVITASLFVVIFVLWPDQLKLINAGFRWNQSLIDEVTKIVGSYSPRWGDRFEFFSDQFNLKRILLFAEAVAVVKLVMLAVGSIFRVCGRSIRRLLQRT